MQSEPGIENRANERGRRDKRGNGSEDGPVFVDNSGRRAKLLRRIGLLLGVVCLGYAVVLGMAFMGWGPSLSPSSLLPFGGGGPAGAQNEGPGGAQPQGGTGSPPEQRTGAPPAGVPSGVPTGVPSGAPTGAPTGIPTSDPSLATSSAPSVSASAAAN
ncbi:hypothetical protein FE633_44910 [Streptomyces montanus]|uniref:Bi-functional transferase/deacetylase n=1 Tax=Streptomyces montanus TaxID=2580423 RepID=A0A5R9F9T4_9ACTN|nr:hypothetical protein [Streptomyces montanus]TLS39821.1 hypothetical protein FE633_44910 [Streptomyces montanus]